MKTLCLALFCLFSLPLFSQIDIKWKTINLNEGYEYEGKIKVYVDGEYYGESDSCMESIMCAYKVKVKGEHTIRIEVFAKYEGTWEAKVIDNNYSYDYVYEDTLTFKKKQTLTLIWDTTSDAIEVSLKK